MHICMLLERWRVGRADGRTDGQKADDGWMADDASFTIRSGNASLSGQSLLNHFNHLGVHQLHESRVRLDSALHILVLIHLRQLQEFQYAVQVRGHDRHLTVMTNARLAAVR